MKNRGKNVRLCGWRSRDELEFSPSTRVPSKMRLVPAGRFQRRVNYTTRREKGKHVKKRKERERSPVGQHTLNVN